jgi:outer membrane immunogenic protein
MKRIAFALVLSTVAGSAFAADIVPSPVPPPYAPAVYLPPPIPFYNWTGFYVGGNLGAGWSQGSFSDPFGNTLSPNSNGQFLGGGQVGFNYEFWRGVVIGIEGDFDWLANSNNTTSSIPLVSPSGVPTGSVASVTNNNRWLTTVTGRLGYAWNRVLVYGKGGAAWVGSSDPTVTINGLPTTFSTSSNNSGWTAGIGFEWAFWANWSARLEYDFIGLNGRQFVLANSIGGLPAGDPFTNNNRNIQLVNVGINYKFGPGWGSWW